MSPDINAAHGTQPYESYTRTVDRVKRHYLRLPGETGHRGFLEVESGQLHCADDRDRNVMRAQLAEEGFALAGTMEVASPTGYHPWATYPINGYVRVIACYQEVGRFFLHNRKLTILDEILCAPAEAVLRRAGVVSEPVVRRSFVDLDYAGSIIWDPPVGRPLGEEGRQASQELQRMVRHTNEPRRPFTERESEAWNQVAEAVLTGGIDTQAAVDRALTVTDRRHLKILSSEEGVFAADALPMPWYIAADGGARLLMSERTWTLFQGDQHGSLLAEARNVLDGLHELRSDLLDKLRIANLPPVMTREMILEWKRVSELLEVGDREGASQQAARTAELCGWERYEATTLRVGSYEMDVDGEDIEFQMSGTLAGETRYYACPAAPRDHIYLEQAAYELRNQRQRLPFKLAVAHPDDLRALGARVHLDTLNGALERVSDGLYLIEELVAFGMPRPATPPPAPLRTVDPIHRDELPEGLRNVERTYEIGGDPGFYFWDCRYVAGPDRTGPDLSRLSQQLDDTWPTSADELLDLLLPRCGGHAPSVFALRAKRLYPQLRELTALPALRGTVYERFGPWYPAGSVAALTFGRLCRRAVWETGTTAVCPICRSLFQPDGVDPRPVAVLGAAWWCDRCSRRAQYGTPVKSAEAAVAAIREYARVSGLPPRAGWSANPLPDSLTDERRNFTVMHRILMPDAESVQALGGWKVLVGRDWPSG
jgi:hypothetical protein